MVCPAAPSWPIIRWNESGEEKSARWRSESGTPAPQKVVVADDRMSADAAYRLACEGTALLWRGDFHNARQLLQAMARRADEKPRKRKNKEVVATPVEAFHLHRQAQSQRARTLGMLLLPFAADHSIPLRRAPDVRAACMDAYGAATEPYVASLRGLQGLIGAYEWRKNGVEIPALGARIHPHYGVFAPIRGEYIGLVNETPLPELAGIPASLAPTLPMNLKPAAVLLPSPACGESAARGAEPAGGEGAGAAINLLLCQHPLPNPPPQAGESLRGGRTKPVGSWDSTRAQKIGDCGLSRQRGERSEGGEAEQTNRCANSLLSASRSVAFDIGTGTGVLAAVLARRGIERIVATDQDQRALACARENLARLGFDAQVEVVQADLFPAGRAALVVCNPPWVPARPSSPLEHAIFDPDSRMLRGFLSGLAAHLETGGEGWLILSDLAEHLGLRTRAELLAMIDAAGLKVLGKIDVKPHHPRASDTSDPLHAARAAELTSLWRLAAK